MDPIDPIENTREVPDGRIRIAGQLQRDIYNFVGSLERLPFATWPVLYRRILHSLLSCWIVL